MKLQATHTPALQSELVIPGSKSQSIRALMIALLAEGEARIENLLSSDDSQHAKTVCASLGLEISDQIMKSKGLPLQTSAYNLHSGNSGITTCFVLPILGLRKNSEQEIILDCFDQMRQRSIKPLISALRTLGMKIENDILPLKITGKLLGGKTEVSGVNSQYLSALLLSLPCAPNDSELRVKNLQERPYVELTLAWLRKHNIHYFHERDGIWDIYKIKANQKYLAQDVIIPGDYSSASYAIAAAAMRPGRVVLRGLAANDQQGDKRLINILQSMGADIEIQENQLIICGGKNLQAREIDASDIPDLLPILAVLGTYTSGKTILYNVAHAREKETDRIKSMSEGLKKLGAKIQERADGMIIYQSSLQGAAVNGYEDHRTVMALSVAGLLAEGKTSISTAEAINKTYPGYVEDMKKLGAHMELSDE